MPQPKTTGWRRWRDVALAILVIPLVVLFHVVFLAILSPWIARSAWQGWRGRRRLRREGRWLTFDAARRRLEAEGGTLLVALGPKGLGDGCWVSSDALDPDCPLPAIERGPESFHITWKKLDEPRVKAWCDRHLPPLASRASLVARPWGGWQRCEDPLVVRHARVVQFFDWPDPTERDGGAAAPNDRGDATMM